MRHGTVDTAAQLHVCGLKGARGKGARILLKGITGDTVDAERADVVFPVTTTEGKRYAIFMQNQALLVDKETETLLSVAVLLKAGVDVKFVTGIQEHCASERAGGAQEGLWCDKRVGDMRCVPAYFRQLTGIDKSPERIT